MPFALVLHTCPYTLYGLHLMLHTSSQGAVRSKRSRVGLAHAAAVASSWQKTALTRRSGVTALTIALPLIHCALMDYDNAPNPSASIQALA